MKLPKFSRTIKNSLRKALVVGATLLTAVAGANFTALPANAALSYNFTTWTFTSCGATGSTKPTLAMCQSAYSASSFASNSSYFTVDSLGQQWFKPPASGYYKVEIAGAAGGGTNGGKGEVFQALMQLTTANFSCFAVGQKGQADTQSADSGGGGGATYMYPEIGTSVGGANCLNAPPYTAGGGGGGGTTPGADATNEFNIGTLYNLTPGTNGSGRGAGIGATGTAVPDGAVGGPLTGASARSSVTTADNTGAFVGGVSVAGSSGTAMSNKPGTFGQGRGGDGGYPDGGASCDCVSGGGGGGGGGYGGGGGGYNADGTGGGGGGGGGKMSNSNWGVPLGATNTGDGYIKISYEGSLATLSNLTISSLAPSVGQTLSVTPLSLPNLPSGTSISYKWQTTPINNTNSWGATSQITPIPGESGASITVPVSAAGKYIRAIEMVTMPDGWVMYYPSTGTSYVTNYTHTITGSPPSAALNTTYAYQMGLSGYFGSNIVGSGWALNSGAFPTGLSITAGGNIQGTPTVAGTYTFTLKHSNGYETAISSTLTITVGAVGTWVSSTPPSLSSTPACSPSCRQEDSYSYQYVANPPSGETVTSYVLISGTLPNGLTLDPSSGLLSGTLTANSAWTFKVRANFSGGGYIDSANTSFLTGGKTAQGTISYSYSPSNTTWNISSPPTTTLTWTQNTPTNGISSFTNLTPTICNITSSTTASPITLVAKRAGTCQISINSPTDSTYASAKTTANWVIAGMAQAAFTVSQTSGSLQWTTNNPPTVTVTASGGSGTGAVTYGSSTASTICSVDPVTGVVTWFIYNSCIVTASKAADANYALAATSVTLAPLQIAQTGNNPVTVTNAPSTLAYLGTVTVSATGGDVSPGGTATYQFNSLTPTYCSVTGAGLVTALNSGTCQIQAKINSTGIIAASGWGAAVTIAISGNAQAALTISGSATFVAGGAGTATFTLAGGSGLGTWTWSNDASVASICTGSGTTTNVSVTMKGAGTCLLNVTHSAQGGYLDQTQQLSITIAKATQSVSATFSPTSLTYNPTTPATFTVTGSGGGTGSTGSFVYSIDPTSASICSISGNVVTALGAGACIVNTYKAADANFLDSSVYAKTMNIAKANQGTVTVTANRTTLTGSDSTPLVVTASGGNGTGAYTYTSGNTTYCTVDASTGVVTAVKVTSTSCTITATRAGDSNFNASAASASITINVTLLTQATFTASSTVTTTTYGAGTFTVSSSGGSGTGSTTYASGNTAICTVVSTTGVVTIAAPGSCVITATKAADSNYLSATASVTITINKANQATFTATANPTSGTFGSLTSATVTGSGGTGTGSLSWSSADTSICTVGSTGAVVIVSAGSCVITVTRAGGTNYNDISASATITIAKATQATVTASANRTTGTYGDGLTYTVTGSGGTGATAFVYSSNSATVCSVDSASGAVTILTAGTCSIKATRPGGVNYSDASANVTITIAKASQSAITAIASDTAPAYTESPKATVQVSYTGGNGTGAVTYSTTNTTICSVDSNSGLVTDIAKGKCIVTVSIAADASYNAASAAVTIRFGKLDQAAVTVSSTRTSVVYGAGSPITVSLAGGSGTGSTSFATTSANCSVNASTGVVTYTNAGSCVVTATKAGDIDYADASGSVTITVTQATQSAVTATLSKSSTTYGNGDSITASYTGGSGTGAASYSTSSSACSIDSATGAITVLTGGSCVITVTIAADTNYNAASANVTLTINKATQAAVTASVDNASSTYGDGTVSTVSLSGGSGTGSVTFASTTQSVCSVNSSTGVVTVVTAGTCSITATRAADANYLAASDTATITISKASQASFTASKSGDTTYGSATVITVTGSGGTGSGSISYASTTTGICTVNASTGVITIVTAGDCSITATKAADASYNSTSATITVTIAKASQAAVTASSTKTSVTYGDGSTITVSLAGGSGSGSVSYGTSSSACTVNSTTGAITVVTAGTCVVTGTKASDTNYVVASNSVTITIAAAAQASFTASKTGDTTYGSATVVTVSGVGGSGTGSVTFATSSSACTVDATSGVITIVTAGSCVVTATKAADINYNVATASVTVTISRNNQAVVAANVDNPSVTFGDGTSITVSGSGGSGTGSWSYSSTTTGVCTIDSASGVVTVITAGTCSISANHAGDTNYFSRIATATITISKASQASFTASKSGDTTYGSATVITVTGSGGTGSGSISYASTTTGICTVNASTGVITIVTAGDCSLTATKAADASYNSTSATITVTIAKASQATVTASSTKTSVTYGDGSTITVSLAGGSGTGSVSFSTSSSACTVNSTTGAVTVVTAGTCVVTGTKASDTNYVVASDSVTIAIAKANQATLTATKSNDTIYGSANTVSASASGGSGAGGVTYSTSSSACSVDSVSGVITIVTAGSCLVTATKAADINYNVATASVTVSISKATQATVTATPSRASGVYGDGVVTSVTAGGGSGTGSFSYASTTPSVCSVDAATGVVTVNTAGTCSITVTSASDTNYNSATGSTSISIAKATQATVTASKSGNTTYGSATVITVSLAGGSGNGSISYSSNTTGICTVNASSSVITIVTAGDCSITATKAGDTNYNAASSDVVVTIAKSSQAAITANSTRTSATYGDGVTTTVSLSGGSGTGANSFSTSSSSCSVNSSSGVVTVLTAGSCVITATKATDTNYLVGSNTVTITIAKATQATLTASKSGDTTYGSATVVTVSASGGSGAGTISYASTTTGICSVDSVSGVITIVTAGTCSVTATKDTDSSYLAATASVSITIAKATQASVTATPSRSTGVYADSVATSVSASGGSGTGSFSYASTTTGVCTVDSATGVVTIVGAGTCSITATKATDVNYSAATTTTSIVISKAAQASVTASKSANTTYGSSTQITVTGSGGSGTGTFSYASTTTGICTVNAATGVIAIVTAGDCVLTATKAGDSNYNAASGSVTITIAKANQAAVTASATRTTSTYADGSSNTIALSGGSGTGSTSFASTTASVCSVDSASGVLTVLTAGTCTISITKAGDTNYNLATASINITINKATQATFTVSSSPSSTTYGSATTVTISGTGGSGTGSVSYATTTASVCSVNASTGVITIVSAGTCSVTATRAADVNYNVASGSTSVVINKATQAILTLTPANSSVVYGDGQSANVSYGGGSGTGAVTYASNSSGICSVNSTTGAVTILTAGTCSITATKAADTNYNVATASANIVVSKASQASVVVTGNQSLTFSSSNPTSQLAATGGSGNGAFSYDSATTSVCVVSAGGLVTGLHAGNCTITVTKAADTNYNAATASYTITIAKAAQATLVVNGSANLTYSASNAATTQLNVSGGSSSSAVTFAVDSSSTGVCSVAANGLVTDITAGTCMINVTKAGDNDYLDRSTSFTVNIAKATQATLIVRTAADLNFNPTTPATTTVSLSAGGSGTGAVTFTTASTTCSINNNVVTALAAGACVITVTKAADVNFNSATADYTITIGKSLQTALTATPSKTTLKFGDATNNSATVTLTGGSGTGAVNWFVDPSTAGVCSVDASVTPAVVTALAGGSCIVNITKAGDANYQAVTTSVTFTINKNQQAALTVSSDKTSAIKNDTATLSATGGSTTGAITFTVVTGGSVCSVSGTTLTFIGAGTCTVKATRAGDANYDAVDSDPITLTATKADQSQLVVAQSAGMLPNVAIGGRNSTSWDVSGGNGGGALSVTSVVGCNASFSGSTLVATAGNSSGNCTIDIARAESSDYRATTYRVSLNVFDLPTAPSIQTPQLTDQTTADGVQVSVPWNLPNTGTFVAPITGYEVQTKTGSNWQVADGGTIAGATANTATIAVTPWTSIYVRVAALSDYATAGTRVWSTYGGNTPTAFQVPGLVTQLSVTAVAAASIDPVTVTGAGFDQTLTPTVLLQAASPVFTIAGQAQSSVEVAATVINPTSMSFRLPGAKLPTGVDSMDVSVRVVATNSMQSTAATFTLTAGDESVDTGLDPVTGKMRPKINTQFEGTYTWSFTSKTGDNIFTSYQCVKSTKVKGKTVCKSYNWVDSTTCSLTQVMPKNNTLARRVVIFANYCQLTPTAKAALKSQTPPQVISNAKFVKLYPKTHLGWILVKGKKTAILKPSLRTLTITLRG